MDRQKISETEALDIIARVFDRNMRRMNYVRGELFIFWGALLSLTALAEYGLYHWTGDVRVLWSWLAPLVCGYIWTVHNSRRKALVRTGFDDLLILIWGMPAMISAAAIVYAVTIPGNTINPVGVMQLLPGTALAITAEFYRGKGSQQSGSFAALLMLSVFELIMAFNYTFRMPFDAQGGTWMLELSAHGILLVLLPGFILRHITRKQCSKN